MKMKRVLLSAIFGLMIVNCFSQDDKNKYLIGSSISYSHDELSNNSLLSNYYPYDKNLTNTLNVSGEFGWFLTSNTLLAIEIEYLSNRTKQKRAANSDVLDINSSGISINPKYKLIKKFSDKIWFYSDFKVVFQYLNHENKVSQLNTSSFQYEYLNMNGTELKYGLAINPGLIFKLSSRFGIKADYSLFNVLHSTIKKTDNSDIDFEDIKAWDYGLNMNLSGFNLGVILTL